MGSEMCIRDRCLLYKYLHMSIRINDLIGNETKTEKRFTYTDVHLDLDEVDVPQSEQLHAKRTNKDLKLLVDEGAIINSIKNIFTTTPGEKLLNPDFGVNLAQWLFEPVSEYIAREIGQAIYTGINTYEPRAQLNHVDIKTDPEQSQYTIQLAITIPLSLIHI